MTHEPAVPLQFQTLKEAANGLAPRSLNGLSLCSGGGGLELGLRIAEPRYRTVCYVERESYAAAALVARMADAALDQAPIWDDVATFDGRPWRGIVDILSAGYPCQPFSTAGRRLGSDDPRHLWPHVARIVGECRPAAVFLENVPNHLRLGFRQVVDELGSMGYRVAAGLFAAEEVGASHERLRLFALAHATDIRCGAEGYDQPGSEQQPYPGQCSGDVANAESEFRWGEQQAPGAWSGRTGLGGDGSVMAFSGSSRLAIPEQPEQSGAAECAVAERSAASEFCGALLPLTAPGPDSAIWPRILDLDSTLEPAFRRMADGMAHRVDRLRLTGNGVVPLAGALAYRTLCAALATGDRTEWAVAPIRRAAQ